MPVKILQKIRDQAILLGPRPPQAEDRHVLVVGHDDPMIVRFHFTPFSSSRRNQCYYPSTRKIPRNFQPNFQKSSTLLILPRFASRFFREGVGGGGKKKNVKAFVCLFALKPRLGKKWDDVRDDSRPDADWISNLWTVEDVEEGNHRK